jgi:hypothetical protein
MMASIYKNTLYTEDFYDTIDWQYAWFKNMGSCRCNWAPR